MEEKLTLIKQTVEGYPVKNLTWKPLDNIIIGQVKYPYANPNLHDGYITVQWRRNGTPTHRNVDRMDLKLLIP
jgi:hypothetical protein